MIFCQEGGSGPDLLVLLHAHARYGRLGLARAMARRNIRTAATAPAIH